MRKLIYSLCLVGTMLALCTACSKDEVYTGETDDCYISAVQLGYMKRAVHTTTKEGKDSTYYITFNGLYYPFTIDQRENLIYNEDSLPKGTRVSAVLATITSQGYVLYRTAGRTDEDWWAYSSSDSIDFSQPLELAVYSTDKSAIRTYTMKVNVHKQEPTDFVWKKMTTTNVFQGMDQMKAVVNQGDLYVFGLVNGMVKVAINSSRDGKNWILAETTGCEDADPTTLQTKGGVFYMSTLQGIVLTSNDGQTWTALDGEPVSQLVAAGGKFLYALNSEGVICRSDDGMAWIEELLDEQASYLPSQHISSAYYTQDNGNERIMLVGSRNSQEYVQDTACVVWSKSWIEYQNENSDWMYYNVSPDNKFLCPQLEGLTVVRYHQWLVALGGPSLDGKLSPLGTCYVSADNGITWRADYGMSLPKELQGMGEPFAVAVDNEHFMWMVCGQQVWRGRLNELGFENKN